MGRWSAAAAAAEHDGDDAARGDWRRRAAEHRDTAAMNSDRQQLSLPLSWISSYISSRRRSFRSTSLDRSSMQSKTTSWSHRLGAEHKKWIVAVTAAIATIQRYNYHSYYYHHHPPPPSPHINSHTYSHTHFAQHHTKAVSKT
jgi:hypothetical protein